MSNADDTQPAIKYTQADLERLRPHVQKFALRLQREQVNQATDELLAFLDEWLRCQVVGK